MYFKFRLFDLTEFIVWNMKRSYDIGLHRCRYYKIRVCSEDSIPLCTNLNILFSNSDELSQFRNTVDNTILQRLCKVFACCSMWLCLETVSTLKQCEQDIEQSCISSLSEDDIAKIDACKTDTSDFRYFCAWLKDCRCNFKLSSTYRVSCSILNGTLNSFFSSRMIYFKK